jgi:hypothetical protein
MAPLQPLVAYSATARRRWALWFVAGAAGLPVCVYLATIYGLRAAVFADLTGAVAATALAAMLAGLVRRTGVEDFGGGRDRVA